MSSLYSIWISNVHQWCKAWWSRSQSMTNDSIYPHLSTKSIPGWLCSHWRRLWVWLRLEGVQLTWLGPLFPSKRLKERGGGKPMCLRSNGIPWIKLSLFSLLLKFPMTLFEHTVSVGKVHCVIARSLSCFTEVMWPGFASDAHSKLSWIPSFLKSKQTKNGNSV